jgi:MFS family permease
MKASEAARTSSTPSPHETPPRGAASEPAVSSAYSSYVLGVLFLVYVFNFIDRQVLSILLPDIKAEIGVSDTYMGFLTGFAFVVFYTFAGIPIARWADRASRRSIIAAGLLLWTSMTAASGLVRSFWELAAARVGVGVGEAAGSPPSHSLISDYFPPERRATALSIYGTGIYIGVALAFVGGGYISEHFGWRSVYLTVWVMGLPLALLVRSTIRELPRGFSDRGAARARDEAVPFRDALRSLVRNRSFVFVVLGTSVQSLSGYGVLAWGPTLLRRVHGMGTVEVGLWLGLTIGITGTLGAYFGGRCADFLGRRDERWYMRLPALESLAGVPFLVGFVLFESERTALYCFIPFYLLGAMYLGPMLSMIQSLVVPRTRATASAINLFVVNMIGLGLGPFAVGFLNDQLANRFGSEAIRYSMLVVGVAGGLASILFYLASRRLREDLAAVRNA